MHEKETRRLDDLEAGGWTNDDFDRDLGRGEHHGAQSSDADGGTRELAHHETADALDRELRDDVPVLRSGAALAEGAVHLDLDDASREPFVARGGRHVGGEQRIVAKRDVDHETWNRLIGRERPADRD